MGLPARVLVEREGDRYILSRNAGNEAIEAVLWFRRRALLWYHLPRTAILPYSVHAEALHDFKTWFEKSNLAQRAWQCCQVSAGRGDTYGSQTQPQRGETPSRSAGERCYGRPLAEALPGLRQSPSRSAGRGVTVDPSPKLSPGSTGQLRADMGIPEETSTAPFGTKLG